MSGMETAVTVRLLSDPAGVIEVPAVPRVFLAIHVGRSVTMSCYCGGQSHRGMYVHGDIDIVPAGTPSIWAPEQPDTALIVSLQPALLNGAVIRNRFQIRDPQIEHIGWALKAEMEAGYPTGAAFTDSLAGALATALIQRHSAATAAVRSAGKIAAPLPGYTLRQALSYIEENLATNLPLAEMAALCAMSVSHFKQMFRRTTGVPVHRYIIQRRVQRAESMLLSTTASISDIALATGFAHQSHLALHMKRTIGFSPAAVRSRQSERVEDQPILRDTLSA
jgi:AraC family transcriptional regulator